MAARHLRWLFGVLLLATPGGASAQQFFLNTWVSEPSKGEGRLTPVAFLRPSSRYGLVVDIALAQPAPFGNLPFPWAVSRRLNIAAGDAIMQAAADPARRVLPLTAQFFSEPILLDADDRPGVRVQTLVVDLEKVRRPTIGPPYDVTLPEPPEVLGRVVFEVHTDATGKTGEAPFGIAIKRQGTIVDIMSARVCVGVAPCPGVPRISEHFEGKLYGRHDQRQDGIVWNAWASEPQARTPEPTLRPDHGYRLTVDLSAISYGHDDTGVFTRATSDSFRAQLDEWTERSVDLEALLVPDPRYFAVSSPAIKKLSVDLDRVRSRSGSGAALEGDPLLAIQKRTFPDFVYGRVSFDVRTRDTVGWATVGLAVWHQGRPVDELTFSFCVLPEKATRSDVCNGNRPAYVLEGIDSLRIARDKGVAPNAAFHVLDLGGAGVVGVFRDNRTGTQDTWRYEMDHGKFRNQLEHTYVDDLGKATDETSLRNRGEALAKFLFPPGRPWDTLVRFVSPALSSDPFDVRYSAPSIFVRMIQQGPNPPLLIPFGLLAVTSGNRTGFLGYFFRIEASLEYQSYGADAACISSWVTALPPDDVADDAALTSARMELGTTLATWSSKDDPVSPFVKMRALGDWLKQGETKHPVALVILSHHDQDRMYFYKPEAQKDDPLVPAIINRTFSKPSVAILNGCGTAGPGAVELVRRLNKSGMVAVVATSTTVDGAMAGAFLSTLTEELDRRRGGDDLTLSDAYHATIRRLSSVTPRFESGPVQAYGAKVLRFSLLGNGALKLCAPPQPAAQ